MLKTLHYLEYVPPNNSLEISSLPVVVLLHGLFGSSDNLSVIRRHLQAQFRVINMDLPDHGQSPHSLHFSFEDYAQQVILTLSKMNIGKASIIGHSLGGKVAMWIAFQQAALIQKLIILDIAPVAYQHRHQNVIDALTAVPLSDIRSRKEAQQFMAKFIDDAGTQAFLLKSLYEQNGKWNWRFNLHVLSRDYERLIDWPLNKQVIYNNETLFIKGENSDYILNDYQGEIKAQFPQAKAKLVKAGHWLHAGKPLLVNTLITKHLLGT